MLGLVISVHAQPLKFQFRQVQNIPVQDFNGNVLKHAWNGGTLINQFFNFDVDQDGIQDMVVFEKSDSTIQTYLRKPSTTGYSLEYSAKYRTVFPYVRDWIVFADYNNDGKLDLYTSGNGTVVLYKNVSNSISGIQFQLVTSQIDAVYYPGTRPSNLYVNSTDNPAILDMDGDGDLDFLAWDIISPNIGYFKNFAVERLSRVDTFIYELQTSCWGRFNEGTINNSLRLCLNSNCTRDTSRACPCGTRVQGPEPQKKVNHVGGTLTVWDQNKDGKFDMLEGDVSFSNLIFAQNTFGNIDSFGCVMDTLWPHYNTPALLRVFPIANLVDVDLDGKKDMIVNNFDERDSKLFDNQYYYRNVSSSASAPDSFALVERAFLSGKGIDHTYFSAPAFHDYDRDGDKDLFVFSHNGNRKPAVYLYQNTNVDTAPSYRLVDTSFIDLSGMGTANRPVPAFGDLNGDGYEDLVIGGSQGKLFFYQNTHSGTNGRSTFALQPSTIFNGFDCFSYASPEIVDLNRDSLLDLVIGNGMGQVWYLQNSGTTTAAVFPANPDTLGGIDINDVYGGNSAPRVADFNKDGKYDLVIGDIGGTMWMYSDIETNLHGTYQEFGKILYDSLQLNNIRPDFGREIYPAFANLDGDSLPDLVIGTYNGGVILLKNTLPLLKFVSTREISGPTLKAYPNPASEQMVVFWNEGLTKRQYLSVFDPLGKEVYGRWIEAGINQVEIDVKDLPSGIYIARFTGLNSAIRIMVNH